MSYSTSCICNVCPMLQHTSNMSVLAMLHHTSTTCLSYAVSCIWCPNVTSYIYYVCPILYHTSTISVLCCIMHVMFYDVSCMCYVCDMPDHEHAMFVLGFGCNPTTCQFQKTFFTPMSGLRSVTTSSS